MGPRPHSSPHNGTPTPLPPIMGHRHPIWDTAMGSVCSMGPYRSHSHTRHTQRFGVVYCHAAPHPDPITFPPPPPPHIYGVSVGSTISLWGHHVPMGPPHPYWVTEDPMGSHTSQPRPYRVIEVPMGSHTSLRSLWVQPGPYRVTEVPMGSPRTLWGHTHLYRATHVAMGSLRSLWVQPRPYGVTEDPMGSHTSLWGH